MTEYPNEKENKLKKLTVMIVVGTRPELIRLSRIIPKLDQHCDLILVHTGQNYDFELNQIFFNELEIKQPDYFLNVAGSSSSETIGNVIIAVDQLLSKITPDCMLVLGDTNSCISILPAKRRKIPTFHFEAGNRCFDMRVPEEINRRIADHIADINITYSSISRDYLIKEGLPPDRVITVGSPLFEVLDYFENAIEKSSILDKLGLTKDNFFVVSLHREENIDNQSNFNKIMETLNCISDFYDIPIIFSLHPRTKKKVELQNIKFHENIKLLKPLGFIDYNKLQKNARAVLSDSGSINEEASILNFPALNLREAHERLEGMEETSSIMVGLGKERIMQGLEILKSQETGDVRSIMPVKDYEVPNVSEKILRIIISYRDFVIREVWKSF